MARRSARLQRRSPTPSEPSSSTWETIQPQASNQAERLSSVVEGQEPVMRMPQKPVNTPTRTAQPATKTPQSNAHTPQDRTPIKPPGEEMHPAHHQKSTTKIVPESRLPKSTDATTPLKNKTSKSILKAITARTPKNRTPIKPAGQEMHPAQFHASTAKVLDEARWLGFQAMGANTAPPKSFGISTDQGTPTKTPVPEMSTPSSKLAALATSPEFRFRFKSPIGDLSPRTNSILNEANNDELFGADAFSTPKDVASKRKTVKPKGKMTRFSDVHMAQFKKMDSIANHVSSFRANPNLSMAPGTPLKRSPSKADLDKPEPSGKLLNKLKRSPSKMDITASTTKTPPTSLKRTESKMDVSQGNSSLPRAPSTVRMVPHSRGGCLQSQGDNPVAKRVKRTETDDAASTRPRSQNGKADAPKITAPTRKITSQTAFPRLASRLMTPTKSSLARSQTVKAVKSASMLPSLLRSPSTSNLFSPTSIGKAMREGVREGIRKTSYSLNRVRSILRTPSRKFSDDPEKVAAGTHMSPPQGLDMLADLPKVPATAPIKKHVNFTSSTLERADQDELGKSPSPMKLRAGSEIPTGAVIYPTLQPGVEYPELPKEDETPVASPSRRLTFGGAPANSPAKFSFQSNKPISFGPATTGTIRMVRKSDASSLADGKKRKLATLEEFSDKENNGPAAVEGEVRSVKKMRPTLAEPPNTPTSTSKLPRRTPKRPSTISKSRLALLSTPKHGKA